VPLTHRSHALVLNLISFITVDEIVASPGVALRGYTQILSIFGIAAFGIAVFGITIFGIAAFGMAIFGIAIFGIAAFGMRDASLQYLRDKQLSDRDICAVVGWIEGGQCRPAWDVV